MCASLDRVSTSDANSAKTAGVSLRAGIPPFYVMDVWLAAAERQRSHGDLVNLSAGQPSAGAPAAVRAAAKAALDNGVVDTFPVGPGPTQVEISPNGHYVYVTNSHGASTSVIYLGGGSGDDGV